MNDTNENNEATEEVTAKKQETVIQTLGRLRFLLVSAKKRKAAEETQINKLQLSISDILTKITDETFEKPAKKDFIATNSANSKRSKLIDFLNNATTGVTDAQAVQASGLAPSTAKQYLYTLKGEGKVDRINKLWSAVK